MDLSFNCPDTVLMLGNESEHMTDSQLNSAARFAAKLGFKGITFKVGDGNIRYRNAHETLQAINAVNDTGMGAMPFIYIYGPKFGDSQIKLEADIITEIADTAFGEVVVDMESEWNNNPRACALLRDELVKEGFATSRHTLIISTWADPVQQGWVQNILELNPIVEKYGAWSPQQYSLWLLQQEAQLHQAKGDIFPEANMMVDPVEVAKQASAKRHKSLWIWYYVSVESMQNLARVVLQTFVKGEETHVIPAVKPSKPVTPIVPKPVTVPVSQPITPIVPSLDDWLNSALEVTEKVGTAVVEDTQIQQEAVSTAEEILTQLATGDTNYRQLEVEAWDTVESIALRAGVDAEHVLNLNPGLEELLKTGLDSVGKLVKI